MRYKVLNPKCDLLIITREDFKEIELAFKDKKCYEYELLIKKE